MLQNKTSSMQTACVQQVCAVTAMQVNKFHVLISAVGVHGEQDHRETDRWRLHSIYR